MVWRGVYVGKIFRIFFGQIPAFLLRSLASYFSLLRIPDVYGRFVLCFLVYDLCWVNPGDTLARHRICCYKKRVSVDSNSCWRKRMTALGAVFKFGDKFVKAKMPHDTHQSHACGKKQSKPHDEMHTCYMP